MCVSSAVNFYLRSILTAGMPARSIRVHLQEALDSSGEAARFGVAECGLPRGATEDRARDSAICFTTHLRSAYLSASVRNCATSLLMFSVRTLSEMNLRRMVSGLRMLWRILPDVGAICACCVGTFGMDLRLP